MLWTASTALYVLYFALPVVTLAMGRRGGPRMRRSVTGGWISGAVLAAAILAVYVVALGGSVSVSQVLLAVYFGIGVMLFLRIVDAVLLNVLWAVLRARHSRWRFALASVIRLILFGGFALPWVMAVLMVDRPKVRTPDTADDWGGLQHELVRFPADDGLQIAGYYFPADGPTTETALLCHGLGGTPHGFVRLIDRLHQAGIAVLAVDSRGHGRSGGQRCTFGIDERADVIGAVQYLKTAHPDSAERVVGVGASLGAAALLNAARTEQRLDGVVVLSTYATLTDELDFVSRHHFVKPLGWLLRNVGLPMASLHAGVDLRRARPVDDIAKLWPRPTLIVHGTADEIIPFEQGRRLYDAAPIGRQNDWVQNGTHNGILDDAGVIDRVIDFIRSATPQPVV